MAGAPREAAAATPQNGSGDGDRSGPALPEGQVPPIAGEGAFVVAFESFEGPLDLLLDLARSEKIDLRSISIAALADQFVAYLQRARALKLEIAGEYLVMAAWLAYLKSKLLLPADDDEEEDAESLAEQLAQRLRMLDSIRAAVVVLQARPMLGDLRHAGGRHEGLSVAITPNYRSDLAKLLRAYARATAPAAGQKLTMRKRSLMSVHQALEQLSSMLTGRDWRDIMSFLPEGLIDDIERNGAIAAHLVAGLELARQGKAEIDQSEAFGHVRLRATGRTNKADDDGR